MLEALLAVAIAILIATGVFRQLARRGKRRKDAAKFYFLPWLLSVLGLSLVGSQILLDAIDKDDVVYAVLLVGGFVWALVWAKSQMQSHRRR